ncbi:MAG: hypothetical protein CL887_05570 [Dehalococcoidia bacterium]|nr:hypothetical protein [Dehalococcoidia bacterium]|tara:strand:- start:294 stop:1667 length:1374 start_codon:yes stop_codon:yes gene_type:complete
MSSKTLIKNIEYLITVDEERRVVKDAYVTIDDTLISGVGKTIDLSSDESEYDCVINAKDMVATPGYINGHCHISYAHATRGIFRDDLGKDYLPNVFTLQGSMDADEERLTSLLGITELLKYGTTTFVDPGSTKNLDECLTAYDQSGVRVIVGKHLASHENPFHLPIYDHDSAMKLTENTIKTFDGQLDGRVSAWAMPFAHAFTSDELLQDLKSLCDSLNTNITLHVTDAVEASSDPLKESAIVRLEKLGFHGSNVVLSHCVGINSADVQSLAKTDTPVIVCPTAVLKMGGGFGQNVPLPEMLENGVTVGIGTDAANNSNLIETGRSIYLTAVLIKDATGDVTKIPAETAIELGTIGSAAAIGLGDSIGSIQVGKKADIVLYETMRPEWRTLFNPINNLVYSADGRSVHTVIVDGRVVVEDHKPTFVDEEELIHKVQDIGNSMLKRTGIDYAPRWPIV